MNDINYNLYQLVDRHPVILILMLVVIYFWAGDKTRMCIAKEMMGDKKARLRGSIYSLVGIWVMVGIFQISINHQQTILGKQETCTYYHGHRYDIRDDGELQHSSLCGCKQGNRYLPQVPMDSLAVDTMAIDSPATGEVCPNSSNDNSKQPRQNILKLEPFHKYVPDPNSHIGNSAVSMP